MASLQHILAGEPEESNDPPYTSTPSAQPMDASNALSAMPVTNTPKNGASAPFTADNEPEDPSITASARRSAAATAATAAAAATAASNLSSGNKIRHLKKEDGIPLWRKDIQYDFLKLVFADQTKCFTKYSENKFGFTFAEVYIDAMAKSSKCSKILKEKLLQDTEGAISMAMVCLLVNVGRMNTTLNFFPEMRAQLRTYHSIPALQAKQDPNAYKQLQDAPRLKSILKGATEDEPQPSNMEEIRAAKKPRTNAVNLIFVMAQLAPKVSETHFVAPRDFYDLIMRHTLSSESRARAFLWLIWWYLESDFTLEDSKHNPFGPGQYDEGEEGDGPEGIPVRVPTLESLTEEQAELENVDTEEERLFGEIKRKERTAILASEPSPAMTALKRARKEKALTSSSSAAPGYRSDDEASEPGLWKGGEAKSHHSSTARNYAFGGVENDSVHTRSPSPSGRTGFQSTNPSANPQDMRINTLLNSDDAHVEASPPVTASAPTKKGAGQKGPGRGNWRRNKPKADASLTTRSGQADPTHPVPLLPNTIGNDHSTGSNIAPATPGSAAYSAYSSFPVQGASPSATGGPVANQPDHVPTPSYQAQKRHRGVTQHQSALISHRRAQVDYTLDRRIRRIHITARSARYKEGAIFRAWKRLRLLPSDYDSDEELIRARKARDRADKDDDWRSSRKEVDDGFETAHKRQKVFLAGFLRVGEGGGGGVGDVGEEMKSLAATLRRAGRRLERWQEHALPGDAMIHRKKSETMEALSPLTHESPDYDAAENDKRTGQTRRPPKKRGRERTARRYGRLDEKEVGGDDSEVNDASPNIPLPYDTGTKPRRHADERGWDDE